MRTLRAGYQGKDCPLSEALNRNYSGTVSLECNTAIVDELAFDFSVQGKQNGAVFSEDDLRQRVLDLDDFGLGHRRKR